MDIIKPFNWTCPYCDRITTITNINCIREDSSFIHSDSNKSFIAEVCWIICPNEECNNVSLTVKLFNTRKWEKFNPPVKYSELRQWNLLPGSSAKVFPDYIPRVIRDDYTEACAIIEGSPKASATLSRRCLQGMIRDFWKVKPDNLNKEIEAIKDKVDPVTWEAIDGIRKIGNIGAHMEKDINLIIDVEPQEAGALISLIEILMVEWYIHKHEREEKMKKIIDISKSKVDKKSETI